MVDITGLDKIELVQVLWDNARYPKDIPDRYDRPTREEIQEKFEKYHKFIDWINGKVIKCDFSLPVLNSKWYNYENGELAMETIVHKLKECGQSAA